VGSRQNATSLGKIRRDHVERYRFADLIAGARVLDAACGVGYGTQIVAAGRVAVGVDYDAGAIATARKTYHAGVQDFICGDILDAPWGDDRFDTVLSFETLEHMGDPARALARFRASLCAGGRVIVSVPNENVILFRREDFTVDDSPHHRHYTPDQARGEVVPYCWTVWRRS
jgi:2-polyprenyl-3-methyl-5-hydroxy-6-metoxy-1,4-benzoquinol methylase